MLSRRDFIKMVGVAGAGMALPLKWGARKLFANPGWVTSPALTKFVQSLPGLGPTGIPVAQPIKHALYDEYQIEMGQYFQSFHPSLGAAKLWGYADAAHPSAGGHRYLGGVIVAQKRRPVKLVATNNLPGIHPLPIDTTIMGADMGAAQNRATVHLHGGLVPWTSDGGPYSWFTPGGTSPGDGMLAGVDFMNPGPNPGQGEYYYPNDQSARLVWYHDHALGTTRVNAYVGLASGYIIRDEFEDLLIKVHAIPSSQYEIPLIIQDKTFQSNGDLWYPSEYDPTRWDVGPDPHLPLPVPSCVPEFISDTSVINGAAFPFVEVEARKYRFRILNGSQVRFYNLQLYYADSTGYQANLSKPGPAFIQFGTEGGFMPAPVVLNKPPIQTQLDASGCAIIGIQNLLLAPAERADLIIDFSDVPVGSKLIFYNDAPAPYPCGDPPYVGTTTGPDTANLMQFIVKPRVGPKDLLNFQQTLAALKLALIPLNLERLRRERATNTRDLTLNEDFDDYGRLIQREGTNVQIYPGTFARAYADAPTEVIPHGAIEIWRVFNTTADTHPIHLHLVNFQVLSRRPFDVGHYYKHPNGATPKFIGPARGPDPNESGWKETLRMNPGEMTEIIAKWDLPQVPFNVPLSTRTGVTGHEYVWHCHILEHEEHDMMRPLIVT